MIQQNRLRMRKIYHLQTCNTCQRILRDLDIGEDVERQNLKTDPLTEAQLDELYRRMGSYEALFNRRSRQYRERGLHEQTLTEADYRDLLLDHYSFLKRPVLLIGEDTFVGNAKRTVEAARAAL